MSRFRGPVLYASTHQRGKRKANLEVIYTEGTVLAFGNKIDHVDVEKWAKGAHVTYWADEFWFVQFILWGDEMPIERKQAMINKFLGADQ